MQVLFDAAAAIAQVYTYSAYGELLAIHNGAAAVVGTIGQANLESLATTNKLYNGEGFDTRTGLYNFRSRNCSASLGRFERLDPFAGNATDPFSFNKYGFVHGNPVMGSDPTGLYGEFSLGGIIASTAIVAGWAGFSGYAHFRAKKSVGLGVAGGVVGGSAVLMGRATGRLLPIIGERVATGALSLGLKLLFDNLGNKPTDNWTLTAYAIEGFNWGAGYQAFAQPIEDARGFVRSQRAWGNLVGGTTMSAPAFDNAFLGLWAAVEEYDWFGSSGNRDKFVEQLKGSLADFLEVWIGVATATPVHSLSERISILPGLRGLPRSIQGEVLLKLANYVSNGAIGQAVDTICDKASNTIVDFLISNGEK